MDTKKKPSDSRAQTDAIPPVKPAAFHAAAPRTEASPRAAPSASEESGTAVLMRRLASWAKGNAGRRLIVAAGIIGVLLIALSYFWPEKKEDASATTVRLTADEYSQALEAKLAEIIGSIEGAGECRVMVTLENGVEYIYASQQKTNSDRRESDDQVSQRDDSEQNVIIVDTENGKQGLVVTEIQPTVKGVVVVCSGGDQALVQERVAGAITTALNISSRRVCVTKLTS